MKVAVINFSGNVGKTTVARHLLAPRMGAEVIAVESINSDESEDLIRGRQFGQLQEYLLTVEDAVVDIGASNVEDVVQLMRQYRGSHEDFDFFVVPVVPNAKQQRDTIATIDALAEIGVPPERVRVLFNQVEATADPEAVFSGLFAYQASARSCVVNREALIHVNELFEKLKGSSLSIAALARDETDYKARIKETDDSEERQRLARRVSLKRLAVGVTAELDCVFAALLA